MAKIFKLVGLFK